jgi:riboflavin kinase/FMN adenylyltransferase
VTIGSFDGIHKGHQLLLDKMVQAAKRDGARTAVLTFFPHPKRVIQQLEGRYYLTTIAERVQQIKDASVDILIVRAFDEEVRNTRAADYVARLQAQLDMRQLWGGDFALGYQREGDVPFLRELGKRMGFTVELVDEMVSLNGRFVSSSRVRQSLAEGDVADVAACLGRPYSLHGIIVKGKQLGRTINFPTANMQIWDEQLMPGNGVYATWAWLGDGQNRRKFKAATNVGTRPTVNGKSIIVEAHLLDFDEDIYGEEMRLEFINRVRSEMKFDGLESLKAQIQADVEQIRAMLA